MREKYPDPDAALIQALLSGDENHAVSELIQRVKGYLCQNHRVSFHEAEDIASETIYRVYEGVEAFRGQSLFFTWVVGIAKNALREYLRKKGRCSSEDSELLEKTPVEGPCYDPEEQAIKRLIIDDAMKGLTDYQREVVRLRILEQLPSKDVAVRLGKTDNAVRQALKAAMEHFERFRKEQGY